MTFLHLKVLIYITWIIFLEVYIVDFVGFGKLSTSEQIFLITAFFIGMGIIIIFLRWVVLKIGQFFTGGVSPLGSIIIKPNIPPLDRTHLNCLLVKDFLQVLREQQILLNKVYHIRDKEILQNQMSYIEQKVDMLINESEQSFCNLLIKNGKKDYLYSSEYIAYRALLEFMREKTCTKFRHMCKENHFIDKTESEFEEYIRCHVILISDMLTQFSKGFFPYYLSIPGYIESLETVKSDIKKCIIDVLQNTRTCTIQGNRKVEKLTMEFEERYTKITGLSSDGFDI